MASRLSNSKGGAAGGSGVPELQGLLDDIRKFTYGSDSSRPVIPGSQQAYSSSYTVPRSSTNVPPSTRPAEKGIEEILSRISSITSSHSTQNSTITTTATVTTTTNGSNGYTSYSPSVDTTNKNLTARERYEAELARLDAEIDRYKPGGNGMTPTSPAHHQQGVQGISSLSSNTPLSPQVDPRSPSYGIRRDATEGYVPSPLTQQLTGSRLRGMSEPVVSRPAQRGSSVDRGVSDIDRIRQRHQQWKGNAAEIPPPPVAPTTPPGASRPSDRSVPRNSDDATRLGMHTTPVGLPPAHPKDPPGALQARLLYSQQPGPPAPPVGSYFPRSASQGPPTNRASGVSNAGRVGSDNSGRQSREQLILEILRRVQDTSKRQPLIQMVHHGSIRTFAELNDKIAVSGADLSSNKGPSNTLMGNAYMQRQHASGSPQQLPRPSSAAPIMVSVHHQRVHGSTGPQRPPQHGQSIAQRGRSPGPHYIGASSYQSGSQPPPSAQHHRSPSPMRYPSLPPSQNSSRAPSQPGSGNASIQSNIVGSYGSVPASPGNTHQYVHYQQQQYSQQTTSHYTQQHYSSSGVQQQQQMFSSGGMQQQQTRGRAGYAEFHQRSSQMQPQQLQYRASNEPQPVMPINNLGDHTIQHMLDQGYMEGAML